MTATILRFGNRERPQFFSRPACGHIELFENNTGWHIDDVSASGDSRALVGGPFPTRDEALAIAERERQFRNRAEVLG